MKESFEAVLKEFYVEAENEFNSNGFASKKHPVVDDNIIYTVSYNRYGDVFDMHIKARKKILDEGLKQLKRS